MMMSSPEPMSLGSPTQSPTHNNVNQYLPQFLLGDLTSSSNQNHNQLINRNQTQMGQNSKYWSNTNSPPRNHQYGSNLFQPNIQSSLGRSYSMNAYDLKINNSNLIEKSESNYGSHLQNYNNYSPHHDRTLGSNSILVNNSSIGSNLNTQSSTLPGAPPVNRLADMITKPNTFGLMANGSTNNLLINTPNDSSRTSHRINDYYTSSDKLLNQDQLSFTPTTSNSIIQSHRLSPPSPTQIDPFYTYGEQIKLDEKLDDTWITVFGFPQSATSYVLQEFSVYGQILKHASTQGNWLHIQYQTKLQAQKALSKNGKVLANNIMVGVMKCIDKSVMNGSVMNNTTTIPGLTNTSQINNSQVNVDGENVNLPSLNPSLSKLNLGKGLGSSGVKLDRTQSLRTGIRPLGQLNRNLDTSSATTDSLHMTGTGTKLPKKNTNVLSKAMEYMFGW